MEEYTMDGGMHDSAFILPLSVSLPVAGQVNATDATPAASDTAPQGF